MKKTTFTPRDIIVILMLLANFWLVYTGHKELETDVSTMASAAAEACHAETVGLK